MNILNFNDVVSYLSYKDVYFRIEIVDSNFKTVVKVGEVACIGRVEIEKVGNDRIYLGIQIGSRLIKFYEYKTELQLFAWIKTQFIPVDMAVNHFVKCSCKL